jgi:hypothetical protein
MKDLDIHLNSLMKGSGVGGCSVSYTEWSRKDSTVATNNSTDNP